MGRVRSVNRVVQYNSNDPYDDNSKVLLGKIKTHTLDHAGYPHVMLRKDGACEFPPVHRLVAMAFIPNPENKPQVDHIDAVRTNCDVSNLRWVTVQENNDHITEMGHRIDNHMDMFTPEARENWRKKCCKRVRRDDGIVYGSVAEAARKNGHCPTHIRRLITNGAVSRYGHTFSFAT